MTAAPSIALLAVAASVLCYQDCDRAIRSGALIDEYSRAECVPVKLAAGISPPSRGWDYTLKTHAGVPVRVFGSDIVGGEIEVEYLPDGKKAVAANAGDYIYPADVRFERTNDRLYVTVVSLEEDNDQELPPYFPEDRKSGAAGEMVLSVTVEANGKPSKVCVLTSLSQHLDQAAIETVRTWKFKLIKGSPDALPDDFEVKFQYRATCTPSFVMDSSK